LEELPEKVALFFIAQMMKVLLLFPLYVIVFLFSCGKECEKERNELTPLDKTALLPQGIYSYSKDTMPKINFLNDSIAIMTFKRDNKTYRLTYKIDTFGTNKINERKLYE